MKIRPVYHASTSPGLCNRVMAIFSAFLSCWLSIADHLKKTRVLELKLCCGIDLSLKPQIGTTSCVLSTVKNTVINSILVVLEGKTWWKILSIMYVKIYLIIYKLFWHAALDRVG